MAPIQGRQSSTQPENESKFLKKFGVILPSNSEQEMSCFPGLHF